MMDEKKIRERIAVLTIEQQREVKAIEQAKTNVLQRAGRIAELQRILEETTGPEETTDGG